MRIGARNFDTSVQRRKVLCSLKRPFPEELRLPLQANLLFQLAPQAPDVWPQAKLAPSFGLWDRGVSSLRRILIFDVAFSSLYIYFNNVLSNWVAHFFWSRPRLKTGYSPIRLALDHISPAPEPLSSLLLVVGLIKGPKHSTMGRMKAMRSATFRRFENKIKNKTGRLGKLELTSCRPLLVLMKNSVTWGCSSYKRQFIMRTQFL